MYLNMPVRSKINLWFVPLIVFTIAVTGYYSYRIAASDIVVKMKNEQTSTAKQAIDHLNYIAQDAIDISNYLFLTPEIQALLTQDVESGGYVKKDIIDSISRLMVTRPYFRFLTLYSPHFDLIQFNNKGLSAAIPFKDYQEKFDYDRIVKDPRIESWNVEVPGRTKSMFYGDNMNKILLTKVLKSDMTYNPEGIIILGMDEKDFRKSYATGTNDLEIAVIGIDGTILSDSTGKWIGYSVADLPYFANPVESLDNISGAIDSSKWVSAHINSSLTGWHVLVVQPRSKLLNQLNRIQWLTIAIALLTILLGLFVSWSVAGVILKPIKKILISMKKFQKGDFSQQVQLTTHDEIGQFGVGYNTMVRRIRELIDDVYTFELKQKEAEIKVLQSQINPHFLYNTLNTIAWSAQRNGDQAVAEMIYSLSEIFKISLSHGKDIIALDQELQLVNHYLFLQKMRYPNKLAYELDTAPALKEFTLPKLLIQPLVENAVVHGIESIADDTGFIHVQAYLNGEQVIIEVTDNGAGIPPLQLAKLKDLVQEGNDSLMGDNFALLNIRNRIRLHYGDQASMSIESVVDSGTRVILILPFTKR
ncbi:hypothetical protein KCTCHS21_10150 [Cohnella abietis]|uniref:histidine kinase n=2 Tax=Cohnella abietis TaxID=2507935 RepID=A0A3T1D0J5_9BACL|nr:hypothetical protein KCTCHS21_10150 [Cohnella abietis]